MPFSRFLLFFRLTVVFLMCVPAFANTWAQSKDMVLQFSQDGKLLDGYTERLRSKKYKDSSKNFPIRVEVLIERNFFEKDKKALNKIVKQAKAALTGTTILTKFWV